VGDIGFGVCVGPSTRFEDVCAPALARNCPDLPVLVRRQEHSLAGAYNRLIGEAVGLGWDGIVLIHDDVEIRDPELAPKLRHLFEEQSVGVVGVVGARAMKSIRWRRAQCFGRAPDPRSDNDFGGGTHEVDSVDGLFLAVSASMFGRVEFDEKAFPGFHGYDADLCFSARQAGFRVLVTDIDLFHHSRGTLVDPVSFRRAELAFDRKWMTPRSGLRAWEWRLRYHSAGRPSQARRAVARLERALTSWRTDPNKRGRRGP